MRYTAGCRLFTLIDAIKAAGFQYLAYDQKNRVLLIKVNTIPYLIYLDQYTKVGPLFSDMSNWKTFFRSEQKQIRAALFTQDKMIITDKKAVDILQKIALAIPTPQITQTPTPSK